MKYFAFLLGIILFSGTALAHLNENAIRPDMYNEHLNTLKGNLEIDGPKKTLEKLESLYMSEVISSDECHLMAHSIGRKSFEIFGVALAAANGSHVCRSGYFHGLFEIFSSS